MSMPGNRTRSALFAVLIPLLAACTAPVVEVSEVDITHAREALLPFKQELKAAFVAAIEVGPQEAIQVCRNRAPEIAVAASGDGVEMGRTSHLLRNPDNAPRPWMEPLLAEYVEGSAEPNGHAVRIDETTIGYVEPIYAQAMCLTCHGPAVNPAVLAEIHALYPNDAAIGFRDGDFRGLFWVELETASQASGEDV